MGSVQTTDKSFPEKVNSLTLTSRLRKRDKKKTSIGSYQPEISWVNNRKFKRPFRIGELSKKFSLSKIVGKKFKRENKITPSNSQEYRINNEGSKNTSVEKSRRDGKRRYNGILKRRIKKKSRSFNVTLRVKEKYLDEKFSSEKIVSVSQILEDDFRKTKYYRVHKTSTKDCYRLKYHGITTKYLVSRIITQSFDFCICLMFTGCANYGLIYKGSVFFLIRDSVSRVSELLHKTNQFCARIKSWAFSPYCFISYQISGYFSNKGKTVYKESFVSYKNKIKMETVDFEHDVLTNCNIQLFNSKKCDSKDILFLGINHRNLGNGRVYYKGETVEEYENIDFFYKKCRTISIFGKEDSMFDYLKYKEALNYRKKMGCLRKNDIESFSLKKWSRNIPSINKYVLNLMLCVKNSKDGSLFGKIPPEVMLYCIVPYFDEIKIFQIMNKELFVKKVFQLIEKED